MSQIDVLAVMGRAASVMAHRLGYEQSAELREARVAVSELIEAAQEVLDSTVNATTYPDGPCIPRAERDRLRAALSRIGSAP